MSRYRDNKNIIGTEFKNYLTLANDYFANPDKYVIKFTTVINSKKRHLITYRKDINGKSLRNLHVQFSAFLGLGYTSSKNSYAYKKHTDILDCIKQHLDNDVILKSDIHSYFDSINYEQTLSKIISQKSIWNIKKTHQHSKTDKQEETEYQNIISVILKTCFYDNQLPIGFVSSPVISDFYLNELDKLYLKNKMVTYTRYADDFIISAKGEDAESLLETEKENIINFLNKEKLLLNTKKTYIRKLKMPGDAIHLLGLNLVKTEKGPNRITVSDSFIRETCRGLCEMIDNSGSFSKSELKEAFSCVYGKIVFIKHASEDSYNKFEKMFRIKSGLNISLARKDLANYLGNDETVLRKDSTVVLVLDNKVQLIDNKFFKKYSILESVTISSSVKSIDVTSLNSCSKLVNIFVDENNKDYCSVDGILFNKDKSTIICYPAGRTETEYSIPEYVTSIGEHAFGKCSNLHSIKIHNKVTSICDYAFSNCTRLETINLPEIMTKINDGLFCGCISLAEIEIPENVISIGKSAFSSCSEITNINLPKNTTKIGQSAFSYCGKLETFVVPYGITEIENYTFDHCSSLKDITIPNSITKLGIGAFMYCESLEEITIPKSIKSLSKNLFSFCKKLHKLNLHDNVRGIASGAFMHTGITNFSIPFGIKRVTDFAFENCTELTDIIIPSSVKTIGCFSFGGCIKLKSIEIPDSVNRIDNSAFSECSNLSEVKMRNDNIKVHRTAFNGCEKLAEQLMMKY